MAEPVRLYTVVGRTKGGHEYKELAIPAYTLTEAMQTGLIRLSTRGVSIEAITDVRPDDAVQAKQASEFTHSLADVLTEVKVQLKEQLKERAKEKGQPEKPSV